MSERYSQIVKAEDSDEKREDHARTIDWSMIRMRKLVTLTAAGLDRARIEMMCSFWWAEVDVGLL